MVWQTTAGWRKAPALAQRVCTRGLASPSSISLKNTMNTAGLASPTSTVCCIAFPRERGSSRELVCPSRAPVHSEHLPFISQGRRVHGCWVPDRWAQRCSIKITYCSYIMASQAKEISLLDSFACSWSPLLIMSIMSSRCLVGSVPGDACHVA